MAFNSSSAAAANNNAANWEKAVGFLNFSFPDSEGKLVKLGAIPMKESVALQKWIHELLMASPEQLPKLLAKLTVTYNSATPAGGKAGFSLD